MAQACYNNATQMTQQLHNTDTQLAQTKHTHHTNTAHNSRTNVQQIYTNEIFKHNTAIHKHGAQMNYNFDNIVHR